MKSKLELKWSFFTSKVWKEVCSHLQPYDHQWVAVCWACGLPSPTPSVLIIAWWGLRSPEAAAAPPATEMHVGLGYDKEEHKWKVQLRQVRKPA